jgi:hypothetical protein
LEVVRTSSVENVIDGIDLDKGVVFYDPPWFMKVALVKVDFEKGGRGGRKAQERDGGAAHEA